MLNTADASAEPSAAPLDNLARRQRGRARKNHWILVAVLTLGGLVSVPVLFAVADMAYPNDALSAAIFYGGVALMSVAFVLAVRRATRVRWWWTWAIPTSPLGILATYVSLINLGLVPPPY